MKKIFVSACVFVMFVFVVIFGCSKAAPAGPLGVNKIEPTVTPSATPDLLFKVQVLEGGTPVPSIEVKIAPQGVTTQASAQTDTEGTAAFTVHSGGKWDVVIPGQNSYEILNYVVEPLKNTFFTIELGTQSIDLTLESGNPNLPISPSTVTYKLTYHCDKSKQYKAEIVGVPAGITVTPYDDVLRYNGDVRFITLNVPKSYEGINTFGTPIYVSATAIQGAKKIKSNYLEIKRNWAFSVSADVKFAKTYFGFTSHPDPNPGQTTYWIGVNNYSVDVQNFVAAGIVQRECVSHVFVGSMPAIDSTVVITNSAIDYNEGNYSNLVKATTSAGYDWVTNHNDTNGSITIRFYDNQYLDVKRTFAVGAEFGQMCGLFVQKCFFSDYEEIEKCGNYPAGFGCTYATNEMKRTRSCNAYGTIIP